MIRETSRELNFVVIAIVTLLFVILTMYKIAAFPVMNPRASIKPILKLNISFLNRESKLFLPISADATQSNHTTNAYSIWVATSND